MWLTPGEKSSSGVCSRASEKTQTRVKANVEYSSRESKRIPA
jgi:hypothetical protein